MKAGINIWSFPGNLSLNEVFKTAKDAGFEGVEIALNETGELSLESTEKDILRIKQMAYDNGISLYSLATSLFCAYPFTSNDKAIRNKGKDMTRRQLEVAKLLGCDTILTIPGSVDIVFCPGFEVIDYDVAYDRALEAMRELKEDAEKYKVTIGVENIWNKFLVSPLEMRDFIDKIDSNYVKVYFDVGNVLLFGYPQHWIKILGNRICKIHIKDFRCSVGNLNGFVDLLAGDVPFPEIMKALRSVGYDDWLTAEVGVYRDHKDQILYNTRNSMRRIMGE